MSNELTYNRLTAKTIDEVLAQLEDIIQQTANENSFLCAFAYVYQRTTIEIKKAILEGRFENGPRMEKMDVIFANLYIQAFKDYQTTKNISLSWNYAFDLKNNQITIIQHILMGMNAHINLDLSVAAATVADGKEIIDLKNDFMTVNKILAELTNTMQKGLGKVSFITKLLDIFGFTSDEKIINFSIRKARDFAWINALELALLEPENRDSRISEIDKRVLELSKMIHNPPGKLINLALKLVSLFEIKDMHKLIRRINIVEN